MTTWSGSLHKSFRLLPSSQHGNDDLLAFLNASPGTHKDEILARLPYEERRSRGAAAEDDDDDDEDDDEDSAESGGERGPDPKRYRDLKQVLETCGLLWEDDSGRIRFTEFGDAVRGFMPHATQKNVILIAQYAAFGLSACQLRNPTRAGSKYAETMEVFPFRFIWDAMLRLDNKLNSDELNRALFHTADTASLAEAIERIQRYRVSGRLEDLGSEVLVGPKKNDRIIPVISIASFGWALLHQKDDSGYYKVKDECVRLLEAAVSLPAKHREYESVETYVTAISNAACLPRDYR